MKPMPKSYLSAEEREDLLREGSMNLLYVAESQEADEAGDEEAAWAWLSLAKLPADALWILKESSGAQVIRDRGFDTSRADAVYGPDWLDRA